MIEVLGFPYFWLCVFVFGGSAVARLAMRLRRPDVVSKSDVVIAAFSIPALVAHYGVLTGTALLIPIVWQALAVVVVGANVWFFFSAKFKEAIRQLGARKVALVFVPMTIFSLPFLWAVVQYAFFSQHLFV